MTRAPRAAWDFDYRPIVAPPGAERSASDVVLATTAPVTEAHLREALQPLGEGLAAEVLLDRAPLFWLRVRSSQPIDAAALTAAITSAAGTIRYIAPARFGSQRWAPPLPRPGATIARPTSWPTRAPSVGPEPRDGGFWFLSAQGGGVAAAREATGTGAGTRLAVIDDDAAGTAALDLDAEVCIGGVVPPRAQTHGSLMVGWAAGAPRSDPPFRGVAPDTSPRLYLIAKPGIDVVSLPLAVARAVHDGADVIVCATYIEGSWSPMLDDALAFAERFGRGGLGALVVLPTGRETSSPSGSVHASFSLSLGDPAADPRALCVAPAARAGGWFFYRDRKKLARPFANRGPSVRFLAPGDDVASPLGDPSRLSHAESSGASAIAAGVVLLVLAANPTLHAREVLALLRTTATPVPPEPDPAWAPLADPHDARPTTTDADGHNAKHGYGSLHAERACLAAADPLAWSLVHIGDLAAARAWTSLLRADPSLRAAFSVDLARWMVRALLADESASHAARALARHLRLLSVDPRRHADFPPGALTRQLALLLRSFLEGATALRPPLHLRRQLRTALATLADDALATLADDAPTPPAGESRVEAACLRVASHIFARDGVGNADDSA